MSIENGQKVSFKIVTCTKCKHKASVRVVNNEATLRCGCGEVSHHYFNL